MCWGKIVENSNLFLLVLFVYIELWAICFRREVKRVKCIEVKRRKRGTFKI